MLAKAESPEQITYNISLMVILSINLFWGNSEEVFLFMAGSEAPCMAWVHRFSNRFTLERMILFAMILSACRFFWYGTGPSAILLMATFFLQGIVNGILLIEFIRYAAKVVDVACLGLSIGTGSMYEMSLSFRAILHSFSTHSDFNAFLDQNK